VLVAVPCCKFGYELDKMKAPGSLSMVVINILTSQKVNLLWILFVLPVPLRRAPENIGTLF
jgi:hypothetical protein